MDLDGLNPVLRHVCHDHIEFRSDRAQRVLKRHAGGRLELAVRGHSLARWSGRAGMDGGGKGAHRQRCAREDSEE